MSSVPHDICTGKEQMERFIQVHEVTSFIRTQSIVFIFNFIVFISQAYSSTGN